jgi:hypothetical protein
MCSACVYFSYILWFQTLCKSWADMENKPELIKQFTVVSATRPRKSARNRKIRKMREEIHRRVREAINTQTHTYSSRRHDYSFIYNCCCCRMRVLPVFVLQAAGGGAAPGGPAREEGPGLDTPGAGVRHL